VAWVGSFRKGRNKRGMGARRSAAQGMHNSIISSVNMTSDEEIEGNSRRCDPYSTNSRTRGLILAGPYYLACNRKYRPDFTIFNGRDIRVIAEEVRNSRSFSLGGFKLLDFQVRGNHWWVVRFRINSMSSRKTRSRIGRYQRHAIICLESASADNSDSCLSGDWALLLRSVAEMGGEVYCAGCRPKGD
jgi:hypothetical protein